MKKFAAFLTAALLLLSVAANAQYSENSLIRTIDNAVEWKEKNSQPYNDAGSETADLYIIALKRMGMDYNYDKYVSAIREAIKSYNSDTREEKFARSVMALDASGADVGYFNDKDYIAEGLYKKNNIASVDDWCYALIALNSKDYNVPDWAHADKDEMVRTILAAQRDNGSFGDNVSSTALAIIALEPYTYSDKVYTFTNEATGQSNSLIVMQAVDSALTYLSNEQADWGDYYDLKGTALTLIALDSMDIDVDKDERFLRDGKSVVDGIMAYVEDDGGFSMRNDGSNSLATSYALCALTSHLRKAQGCGNLFDFLDNGTPSGVKQINSAKSNTSNSSNNTSSSVSSGTSSSTASSSRTTKATTKPKTTMRPAGTARPRVASTMRPASSTSPKPAVTPRATSAPRKKALVGPVEMPGPMPKTPEPEMSADEDAKSGGMGIAHSLPIGIAFLALAALITAGGITYIILTKEKAKTIKRKRREDRYEAKIHRRTEIHGAYKAREKYKERGKYKGSYRK